jgi:hypothetical protein
MDDQGDACYDYEYVWDYESYLQEIHHFHDLVLWILIKYSNLILFLINNIG